ncbi:MAG: FmdB family transcriptional regulator [Zavarzinella sp.]
MPLYVYQVVEEDGAAGEIFEVFQKMAEEPLTHHPENGKPVRRLIAMPNAVTKYGAGKLSPSNLDRLGFTQYKKAGDGHYEKTAGSGPDVISGNNG